MATFGILTNIINIRTFTLMGLKDAMTVSFILLSISDFTLSVVSLGMGIGGILYVDEYMFREWFQFEPYILGLFSTNLFIPVSAVVALNTSFISVARCMCVSLPLYFKHVFKRRTSVVFMLVSFVFCAVLYTPVFSYMGVVDKLDPVQITDDDLVEKKKKRTFRKFTYRGVDLDQLLDMSLEQLSDVFNCRQHRRLNRGLKSKPLALIKRLRKAKTEAGHLKEREVVKTHLRDMIIVPEVIGSIFGVYNGETFIQVEIKPAMVGHYLGEFSITYNHVKHNIPGIFATHSSRFTPLK
ncbi:uncharacterized protein LOC131941645 [Physella acuta]|uniref:uncharacterized protein LOC131941645 n=1 Tax=Physella acuta TaxID=109671 RepID=UPI0027DD3CBD|nr:uncharacterized protein LOC131941645 [Physella acuta]